MINNDVIKYLESKFPLDLAYEWDKVGLQIGSKNAKVNNVLVTLDITHDVVEEAINNNVNLIIAHHPFLFNPIKTINYDSYIGKMIVKLIQNNISVYSLHTNYDIAKDGLNDILASKLGLTNTKVLESINDNDGLGRIGTIEKTNLTDLIAKVKTVLGVESLRYIGNEDKQISSVAIVGGSGASSALVAKKANADIFITGDLKYHDALYCKELGLNVLDVGHYVESLFKDDLVNELSKEFNEVKFIASKINTNPFIVK